MTLTRAVLPTQTLPTQALLVLVGSFLIALSAQVTVPMYPVPMTLQTLTISLIGLAYGARLGAVTVLAYLAEGAAGLPVFAGGNAGLLYMTGPTAGFLIGFVPMAFATGWLAERMAARGFVALFIAALIPAFGLFVLGAAWPLVAASFGVAAGWAKLPVAAVWTAFVAPFLLGSVVKSAIAAMMVAGGWRAARR
jgi:biotin transport system substrate-specific component